MKVSWKSGGKAHINHKKREEMKIYWNQIVNKISMEIEKEASH